MLHGCGFVISISAISARSFHAPVGAPNLYPLAHPVDARHNPLPLHVVNHVAAPVHRRHVADDLRRAVVARDDCRQLLIVPVVDDAKELLAHPLCHFLCAEIIQHEKWRLLDRLHPFRRPAALERRADVCHEIRHGGKEHRLSRARPLVGDNRRELCLARAFLAVEKQPLDLVSDHHVRRIDGVFVRLRDDVIRERVPLVRPRDTGRGKEL